MYLFPPKLCCFVKVPKAGVNVVLAVGLLVPLAHVVILDLRDYLELRAPREHQE